MPTTHERLPITAAILAGGPSRRLGVEKALIEVGGETLVRRVAGRLAEVCEHVVVVAALDSSLAPIDLPPGVRLVRETSAPEGPLGALVAALEAAETEWILLAAADMPFVRPEIARLLWAHRNDACAVVPRSLSGLEPLFALYRKACLPSARDLFAQGERRLTALLNAVATNEVGSSALREADAELETFDNLNTPEDLERALARVSGEGRAAASRGIRVEDVGGVPTVSFVGHSGSGKTTLLEGVIAALTARGLRVGVVKHHAHDVEIDVPQKDSWRHAQAGAVATAVSGPRQFAVFRHVDEERRLEELVGLLGPVDVVLTEGFRSRGARCVEVVRSERSAEALCDPGELSALVTDIPTKQLPPRLAEAVLRGDIPCFGLDDAEALADAIILGMQ